MWKALEDEGTVLNVHLGSSGQLAVTAADAPIDVMITLQPMNICAAAADLVWSRVFREFPDLKVALSEGGTGWIPYFLDRLDRTYDMHHLWTGQDLGDRMPSDVFREHILTCFIADPIGIALRDEIGIDNMCWEQDYPHSDSSWPNAPEEFARVAARYDVPDAEVNKITHENAMRWYRFDPFAHRSREQCTVGALRTEVAGHDVEIRSMDKGRFEGTTNDHARRAREQGHRVADRSGASAAPVRQLAPGNGERGAGRDHDGRATWVLPPTRLAQRGVRAHDRTTAVQRDRPALDAARRARRAVAFPTPRGRRRTRFRRRPPVAWGRPFRARAVVWPYGARADVRAPRSPRLRRGPARGRS